MGGSLHYTRYYLRLEFFMLYNLFLQLLYALALNSHAGEIFACLAVVILVLLSIMWHSLINIYSSDLCRFTPPHNLFQTSLNLLTWLCYIVTPVCSQPHSVSYRHNNKWLIGNLPPQPPSWPSTIWDLTLSTLALLISSAPWLLVVKHPKVKVRELITPWSVQQGDDPCRIWNMSYENKNGYTITLHWDAGLPAPLPGNQCITQRPPREHTFSFFLPAIACQCHDTITTRPTVTYSLKEHLAFIEWLVTSAEMCSGVHGSQTLCARWTHYAPSLP